MKEMTLSQKAAREALHKFEIAIGMWGPDHVAVFRANLQQWLELACAINKADRDAEKEAKQW